MCLCWNAWKCKLMYCFYCFEYDNAWSSVEQGKKLQHFLLDRAKFTYLCLEQGQGFIESSDCLPSLPKFLLSTPPPPRVPPKPTESLPAGYASPIPTAAGYYWPIPFFLWPIWFWLRQAPSHPQHEFLIDFLLLFRLRVNAFYAGRTQRLFPTHSEWGNARLRRQWHCAVKSSRQNGWRPPTAFSLLDPRSAAPSALGSPEGNLSPGLSHYLAFAEDGPRRQVHMDCIKWLRPTRPREDHGGPGTRSPQTWRPHTTRDLLVSVCRAAFRRHFGSVFALR